MITELKHPLCAVVYPDGISYGGSQMRSADSTMVKCGCGVVAVQEVLLYLTRYHGCPGKDLFGEMAFTAVVSSEEYHKVLDHLRARYLHLIPSFGINGISLVTGMNAAFRRYGFPYRGQWKIASRNFYPSMEEMLWNDIPVIISVGPNFPAVWGKRTVALNPERNFRGIPAQGINAHYMIATGLDDECIHVSSWGRRYSINRKEYDEYVRRISSSIVSNLVYIKKI